MAPELRGDGRGQMMILAAVILLLAFIALAGMVARVTQLAAQTTLESDKAILDDVGPLVQSLDASICRLKQSSIVTKTGTATAWGAGATTLNGVTVAPALDPVRDVGMAITGTGIPSGTRVLAITGTSLTLSQATTGPGTGTPPTLSLIPCLSPGSTRSFNLTASSSPTMEDSVHELLRHFSALEATHGFFLDHSTACYPGIAGKGQAIVSLSDGRVWLEVRSTVPYDRAGC